MLRELALTPPRLLTAAAKALLAMDGARRVALLLAAGLVASLFAPWFVHTTVAHGLTGPRRLSESFTGWDALPAAAFVCLAASVLVWAALFVRSAAVVSGLGAEGRRAARARVDGALVGALGLAAVVWLAAALADHPGSSAPPVGATTTIGVRWGIALALVLALAITGLGVLIVRAAVRVHEPRGAVSVRGSASESGSAAARRRSPATRARARARARREAAPVPASDPAMPDFDFAVSDEPVPSAPGSASRRAAGPARGREPGASSGSFSRPTP